MSVRPSTVPAILLNRAFWRREKKMLVLLISSESDVQQAVQQTLRAQCYPLVCASSLEKARALIRQATPDVVIADLGSDLDELLPQLSPRTAVLRLSKSSAPGLDDRCSMVLTKPFAPEDLMTAIRSVRGRG
jgi:DNA-binding response OmpR family regulator